MNKKSVSQRIRDGACLSLSAFALLAAGAACAQTSSSPAMSASGAMGKPMLSGMDSGGASKEMQSSMMSSMEKMKDMKLSGDTDKDFAMMMKMHHQQALEMARPEVDHGKSPELKAMARKIIKDQTKEIAQLDAWMKRHP